MSQGDISCHRSTPRGGWLHRLCGLTNAPRIFHFLNVPQRRVDMRRKVKCFHEAPPEEELREGMIRLLRLGFKANLKCIFSYSTLIPSLLVVLLGSILPWGQSDL